MMKNRGQRSWSVGLSMADITNSILTDKNKVHSVSTLAQVEQLRLLSPVALLSSPSPSPAVTLERCVQGWCGIGAEVFLSLPCSMGSSGSTRLAGVSLGPEEDAKLRASVASLSNLMGQLKMWGQSVQSSCSAYRCWSCRVKESNILMNILALLCI